jgi:hypothetical protein
MGYSHYIRRYNLFTNSIYLCKPKLFQLEQINLPKSIRIFCFETWDVWFAIGRATKRSVLISLPPFSLISLRFDLAPFSLISLRFDLAPFSLISLRSV